MDTNRVCPLTSCLFLTPRLTKVSPFVKVNVPRVGSVASYSTVSQVRREGSKRGRTHFIEFPGVIEPNSEVLLRSATYYESNSNVRLWPNESRNEDWTHRLISLHGIIRGRAKVQFSRLHCRVLQSCANGC